MLSKDELLRIDEASVRLLSEAGLRILSETAINLLKKEGAIFDHEKGTMLIPESLIRDALRSAKKDFLLCSRDKKHDVNLVDRDVSGLATDGTMIQIHDYGSDSYRRSTTKDLFRLAIISDYLPEIEVFWPMVVTSDVPESEHTVKELVTSLLGTSKHIQHEAGGVLEAKTEIKIAAAIAGGEDELRKRPIFSAVQSPVSPLIMEKESFEAGIEFVKAGVPVVAMSTVLGGATAPMTLASILTMANAEILGALVIFQTAAKGSPFLYSVASAPMCPKCADFLAGSPELSLISGAAAQLARYYGLPSVVSGMVTDAHIPSIRAGYEKAETAIVPTLAGATIVMGAGGLYSIDVASIEQLVIDCETWASLNRIARGIDVSQESIRLDEMMSGGNRMKGSLDFSPSDFLEEEIWQPRLPIRQSFPDWKASGSKSMADMANEKAKEIIADHHVEPLPRYVEKEINEIYQGFRKKLENKS